jgi:hypothetical protein
MSTYEKKIEFFQIRSKICVAQALPYIRIKAIQQYNSAFMKCERVTATKVRDFVFLLAVS